MVRRTTILLVLIVTPIVATASIAQTQTPAPSAPAKPSNPGSPPASSPEASAEAARRQVIADYVGLYRAETLERWKELFHPSLQVTDPRPDGTVRVRGLAEFYGAQKAGFEAGRIGGERLENIRVDAGRRIARVTADFVFTGEGKEARGRLGLHLVQEGDRWRIVSIVYSYDS